MTTPSDAQALLDSTKASARRAHAQRPGYAVPLLILSALIVGAMPFYIQADPVSDEPFLYATSLGGLQATLLGVPTNVYWFIGLPLAYVAIAFYLRRQSSRAGVALSASALTLTGLGLLVVFVVVSAFAPYLIHGNVAGRALEPLLTIAVGLLGWAIQQRSVGLGVTALLFTGAALVANLYNVENLLMPAIVLPIGYELLANLALCAGVLIVAAALFAIDRRRGRA